LWLVFLKPEMVFSDFSPPSFLRLFSKKPGQRKDQLYPLELQKLKKVGMPFPHHGTQKGQD
jgi:hypothetical protein